MAEGKSISGLKILGLRWENGKLGVLSEEDHLLRRFGQLDLVKLEPGLTLTTHRVNGSDEIWTLISGEAELMLTDQREESPTNQQTHQVSLNEKQPQVLLIPFGVEVEISSHAGGLLLRVSSHADYLSPADRIFEPGEKAG